MHLLSGKERVITWLKKHGWPDTRKSNAFIWAISPVNGQVPGDSWTIWDGSWESLPKDKKVIFKVAGLKTYTHIHLDSDTGVSEKKGVEDPIPVSAFMLPPEIVKERNELAQREEEIKKREANLRQWDSDLRDQELDIKKSQAMTIRLGSELDNRTEKIMARMKEYEEHLDRRKLNDEAYIRELSETTDELSDLKEKHLIFGKVSYTIDKIAMSFAIRGMKNLSNEELKKLPPGFIEDFGRFCADRAERELFRTIPDAFAMVGESFLRLPSTVDKYELARIVMAWLIETDLSMFNKLGKDVVEEFKKKQSSS